MEKGWWDKLEVLVAAMSGVLVPLAIFLAGLFISNVERDNATMSLQAERLTELIEHFNLSARYGSSKDIRPRHYELWFGKDA